jgi:hypothetical protein
VKRPSPLFSEQEREWRGVFFEETAYFLRVGAAGPNTGMVAPLHFTQWMTTFYLKVFFILTDFTRSKYGTLSYFWFRSIERRTT